MKPEDYFTTEKIDTPFGSVERIRIKGHRISIEHVLERYQAGETALPIVENDFPSLSQDEVNAVIQYYEANRNAVDQYLRKVEAISDAQYREHLRKEPSAVGKQMRELSAKKQEANTNANGKMPPPVR